MHAAQDGSQWRRDRPAVARGLATLAADNAPEREHMYMEAAALVFDRMTVLKISQLGELQC